MVKGLCRGFVAGGSSAGTVYRNVAIPNSVAGGYHPHPVNIIAPAGAHSAALIVLHGGGGTSTNMLKSLGLVRSPDGNTWAAQDVSWGVLQAFGNIVVASPQGWIDPRTITPTNPDGTASWANKNMNSGALAVGWDDMQMLADLRNYLRTQFALIGVSLYGHSNGGMMANRVMLENPTLCNHYIVTSGPLPSAWSGQAYTFPNLPYCATYGALDDVVNLVGSGGLFAAQWNQTISTLSIADDLYPALSSWIGEWQTMQARVTAAGGGTVRQSDGVMTAAKSGTLTEWNYGKTVLRLLSAAGHEIASQDAISGTRTLINTLKFIRAT